MSQSPFPSIRLLIDQGVPAGAALIFRELGYDCHHVSELGMQKAADHEILALARTGEYTLITLDADFHALVAVQGGSKPSIVRLRREGCNAETVTALLVPVLRRYLEDLRHGCLISVKENRTTCHRLPVGQQG